MSTRRLAVLFCVPLFCLALLVACGAFKDPKTVVTLEKEACVLLQLAEPDARQVCAFADDLAPLAADLLAAAADDPAPATAKNAAPVLAFRLPAASATPRHHRKRRHCAVWQDAGDAGPTDAAKE